MQLLSGKPIPLFITPGRGIHEHMANIYLEAAKAAKDKVDQAQRKIVEGLIKA